MDDLLSEFLTECHEGMALLDNDLVRLERNAGDLELVAGIFRVMHTIKGTCGFLGQRLEQVAHAAENLLGRLRDRELTATPPVVSAILSAADRIKAILDGLAATQEEPAGDDAELLARLEACAAGSLPEPVAGSAPVVTDALATVEPVASPVATPAVAEPAAPAVAVPAAGEAADAVAAQTLRVRLDVLEQLMTLVGELVLTRNQLLQLTRTTDDSVFKTPLQRLSHLTTELQEGVMRTRMQPIGNAWGKLPRLVRDLGLELGKQIELKLIGADTELDRQILELIKDPLTHMVRNSADHGLELPADRRRQGKPETGTIRLEACHEGGHIVIRLGDDGRGLNVERIRTKALENGLASEAELAAMSPDQLLQIIFKPGFSTAEQVSSVSGRGVGMDVVRTNIERIGGSIELDWVAGRGTTLTIRIPLTLAIVSVLIVAAGGQRFAVPQLGVIELVRAGPAEEHRIEVIDGAAILRLRGALLPLVSLADVLGLEGPGWPRGDQSTQVVVTQLGSALVGVMVDRVFDTEEIVVKPLARMLRQCRLFAGNTILGDGSVVMILDLAAVVGAAAPLGSSRPAVPEPTLSADTTTLLLFEAGDARRKAVPLGLVTRLEEIEGDTIESSGGRTVVQYRGALMPVVGIDGGPPQPRPGRTPVLVFTDSGRNMGLVVDRFVDIVDAQVQLELAEDQAMSLGTTIIQGVTTDLIDVSGFVARVFGGWFTSGGQEPFTAAEAAPPRRVLLVDDSSFFRSLLKPQLELSGYSVTTASGPQEALRLREAGQMFDAIISDIEMPGMDGFTFAAACRAGGAWEATPIIALTSHITPRDVERGRASGFTNYVGKLEREALLAALTQSRPTPPALV